MTLTQGTTYRAYLHLPFYATQGMAKTKLENYGFADVSIYEADGKLVVQGRWTGATQEAYLPSYFSDVVAVTP